MDIIGGQTKKINYHTKIEAKQKHFPTDSPSLTETN